MNSSPPSYPIKEKRVVAPLRDGKGNLVDLIIDVDAPSFDPKVKAVMEKRIAQEQAARVAAVEKEKKEMEEKWIAQEKSKKEAEEKRIAQEKERILRQNKKWYEGGTLHQATVADWLSGDESNKLATCADWAIRHEKIKSIVMSSSNIDTLKPFASELCKCVTGAIPETINQNEKVVGLVVAPCAILMWGASK